MAHKDEEEAWTALSDQLGEALLDAERTFLDLAANRYSTRWDRDAFVEQYLSAWSRLADAHRNFARFLHN